MPFWSGKSSAKVIPLKSLPDFSLFNNENNNDKLNDDRSESCKMVIKKLIYLNNKLKELQEELNKAELFKKKGNNNEIIRDINRRIQKNTNVYMYYESLKRMFCDGDFSGKDVNIRNNEYDEYANVESHVNSEGWQRMKNTIEEEMKEIRRQRGLEGGRYRKTRRRKARRSSSRKRT